MAGKTDVTDYIADNVDGLSKKQAAEAFEATFDYITKALKGGDRVQIGNFGSFSVSSRAARKGRNPATGATITIAASKNVKFKPATTLKAALNKKK